MPRIRGLRVVLWPLCAMAALALLGTVHKPLGPTPRLVPFDPAAADYVRILDGPPETVSMRSGYVVLQPSKTVGQHNTDSYEEAVIVLEGQGEMRLAGGRTFQLRSHVVAYCPPRTVHDVANTGQGPLRYVYVVAKAR